MILQQLIMVPVLLLLVTTLVLVLNRNWKLSLITLLVQYVAVFWLTATLWPLGLAAVKLVAGWMSGAVLSASQITLEGENEKVSFGAGVFRILSAGVIWMVVFTIAPTIRGFVPVQPEIFTAGLLLIGMGLLHLGMTTRAFQVVLGLLTLFSGFEIIYAGIEESVLLAGLLAAVNLGMAAVGAYLLTYPTAGGSD